MPDVELQAVGPGHPDVEALERISEEALPEYERFTFGDMFASNVDGNLEILEILADGMPAGFLVTRRYREITYLAYLAVRIDLRSKGIGGGALRLLLARNAGRRTIVEFESPAPGAADGDLRLRRRSFYLRNGFSETGWYTYYDDTEFEIACAGLPYDPAAFDDLVAYLGTIVSAHVPTAPYRRDA